MLLILNYWCACAPMFCTCNDNFAGEGGVPINVEVDRLSVEERRKYDAGWSANAFNDYASEMMSLHRSLPDVRDVE